MPKPVATAIPLPAPAPAVEIIALQDEFLHEGC